MKVHLSILQWVAASIALLVAAGVPSLAHAHKLIRNDGLHDDASTALTVKDISISQVIYHEISKENPDIWLSFSGRKGETLHLQVGVPVLEDVGVYRPSVKLLTATPEERHKSGAPSEATAWSQTFSTDSCEPRRFFEHFTRTESDILLTETLKLPADGVYYIVAFHPGGQTGKLWVAVGHREVFTSEDMRDFSDVVKEVRSFHEVDK